MFDYETTMTADGCVMQDIKVCCLLNEGLTGSFAVSEFCDQVISIHSEISRNAESFCNESPSKIDLGPVYCIQSEIKAGKNYSVQNIQSKLYRIAEHISNGVFFTVNALKGFFAVKAKRIRRTIEKIKEKRNRYMGYSLCLLRL